MPAAQKASKLSSGASQNKTAKKAVKAAPKVKAKTATKQGKPKLTLVGQTKPKQTTAPPGRKGVVAFKAKRAAGEPRNIILELWKHKEEKRRNEAPHTKFHQTGPPSSSTTNAKHASFARFSGPRRRAV